MHVYLCVCVCERAQEKGRVSTWREVGSQDTDRARVGPGSGCKRRQEEEEEEAFAVEEMQRRRWAGLMVGSQR